MMLEYKPEIHLDFNVKKADFHLTQQSFMYNRCKCFALLGKGAGEKLISPRGVDIPIILSPKDLSSPKRQRSLNKQTPSNMLLL